MKHGEQRHKTNSVGRLTVFKACLYLPKISSREETSDAVRRSTEGVIMMSLNSQDTDLDREVQYVKLNI